MGSGLVDAADGGELVRGSPFGSLNTESTVGEPQLRGAEAWAICPRIDAAVVADVPSAVEPPVEHKADDCDDEKRNGVGWRPEGRGERKEPNTPPQIHLIRRLRETI